MRKLTLALSVASLAVSGAAFAQAPGGPQGYRHQQGPITREEAAAHADQIFAKLDVNGDGKLDQADRAAHRDQRFDKLDTDGNGTISRKEFDAAAGKLRERVAERVKGKEGRSFGDRKFGADRTWIGRGHGRRGHSGAGLAMMAKMADTNGDGAISKDEFKAAALAMFDRADANGNGTVTPEERRQMHREHRGEHRNRGDRGSISG